MFNTKLKPGENMLCIEIVSDIQNNFGTQHVLPVFCKKKSFDKDLPLPCNYWLHNVKEAKEVFESIFDQRSP